MANDTAPKFGTLLQPDFQVQTFGHRCNGYHLGGWRTKMGSLQSNESNHNAMALLALIEQHAGEDFIREVMIWPHQVMVAEVGEITGSGKCERASEVRETWRNGFRPRGWKTRVGTIQPTSSICVRAAKFPAT